jgi:hypothetical protein
MRYPTTEGLWGQGRPGYRPPVTAVLPLDPVDGQVAADGQSADRSGSLHLPLPFLKKAGPAGGGLRTPLAGRPPWTGYARYRRSVTVLGMASPLRRACRWSTSLSPTAAWAGGSLLPDTLSAQLCLPDLWRSRCDLGARPPRRLAHEDRRVTLCRASSRRLANGAGGHRGRASPSGRAGDPHWRARSKVVPPGTLPPSCSSHPGRPQGGSRAVDGLPGDGR